MSVDTYSSKLFYLLLFCQFFLSFGLLEKVLNAVCLHAKFARKSCIVEIFCNFFTLQSASVFLCSGDGTLRKNPLIWKKWTPQLGMALFR